MKSSSDKRQARRSTWMGLLLVIVAAVTLEATALVQYYFSQKGIREEASSRAESQMEATRNRIMDVVNQTEAAVRNSIWITQWALAIPDSLQRVAQRIVEDTAANINSLLLMFSRGKRGWFSVRWQPNHTTIPPRNGSRSPLNWRAAIGRNLISMSAAGMS